MTDGFPFAISQDDINWARQTRIDILERDQLTVKNRMKELTQKLAEKDTQLSALLRENELLREELASKKEAGEL